MAITATGMMTGLNQAIGPAVDDKLVRRSQELNLLKARAQSQKKLLDWYDTKPAEVQQRLLKIGVKPGMTFEEALSLMKATPAQPAQPQAAPGSVAPQGAATQPTPASAPAQGPAPMAAFVQQNAAIAPPTKNMWPAKLPSTTPAPPEVPIPAETGLTAPGSRYANRFEPLAGFAPTAVAAPAQPAEPTLEDRIAAQIESGLTANQTPENPLVFGKAPREYADPDMLNALSFLKQWSASKSADARLKQQNAQFSARQLLSIAKESATNLSPELATALTQASVDADYASSPEGQAAIKQGIEAQKTTIAARMGEEKIKSLKSAREIDWRKLEDQEKQFKAKLEQEWKIAGASNATKQAIAKSRGGKGSGAGNKADMAWGRILMQDMGHLKGDSVTAGQLADNFQSIVDSGGYLDSTTGLWKEVKDEQSLTAYQAKANTYRARKAQIDGEIQRRTPVAAKAMGVSPQFVMPSLPGITVNTPAAAPTVVMPQGGGDNGGLWKAFTNFLSGKGGKGKSASGAQPGEELVYDDGSGRRKKTPAPQTYEEYKKALLKKGATAQEIAYQWALKHPKKGK